MENSKKVLKLEMKQVEDRGLPSVAVGGVGAGASAAVACSILCCYLCTSTSTSEIL